MESLFDLLNLPTVLESQLDRNYHYPPPSDDEYERYGLHGFIDPFKWRKQRYRQMFHDYHYDAILRLQTEIEEYDKRISTLSKGAMPGRRTMSVVGQKNRVLRRLQLLENGWRQISSTLRHDSRQLFKLPRELREKIYGYLYDKNPVAVSIRFPDPDVRSMLLPSDPYCYTNASIVDPQIAREAAQVLYDTNTFDIEDLNRFLHILAPYHDMLTRFLRTDHFGSGVFPKDIIRRLRLDLNQDWRTRPESNYEYEMQCRQKDTHNMLRNDRRKLAGLLEMTSLQLLTIHLQTTEQWRIPELRNFSPFLAILKKRGTAVRLVAVGYGEIEQDYSWVLEKPNEEEVARLRAHREWTEEGNVKRPPREWEQWDAWSKVEWRGYYTEHQRVFERMEFEEKMGCLVKAKGRIDAVNKALALQKGVSK